MKESYLQKQVEKKTFKNVKESTIGEESLIEQEQRELISTKVNKIWPLT